MIMIYSKYYMVTKRICYRHTYMMKLIWLKFHHSFRMAVYLVKFDNYMYNKSKWPKFRSSHSEVFLRKGALKICSTFTGEHPCRRAISMKLLRNFIEIAARHGCSPLNLLHIVRTSFLKNTSEGLLVKFP